MDSVEIMAMYRSNNNNKPSIPYLEDYNGARHWSSLQHDLLEPFQCRPSDVWVCSFPRSGTTVTQQIVYLLMTRDFKAARTVQLDIRFPFADVERSSLGLMGLNFINDMPLEMPRLIKSHLHHFLLPRQLREGCGKIVYVARNPKSCAPSYYKLEKYVYKHAGYTADTLELFMEGFLSNKTYATPWGSHVSQYWDQSKQRDNIHVFQFEYLVKDRKQVIRNISKFLEQDVTEDEVDLIFNETSIESMKKNPAVNLVHLESLTDGWKDTLTPEMAARVDSMVKQSVGHTDLTFT